MSKSDVQAVLDEARRLGIAVRVELPNDGSVMHLHYPDQFDSERAQSLEQALASVRLYADPFRRCS